MVFGTEKCTQSNRRAKEGDPVQTIIFERTKVLAGSPDSRSEGHQELDRIEEHRTGGYDRRDQVDLDPSSGSPLHPVH